MKYFVDQNGLIAWVNDEGQSNHPAISNHQQKFSLTDQYIIFLSSDDCVNDEYVLWDNLTALAVAIENPAKHSVHEALEIDTAVAMAHKSLEQFRTDWHNGHKDNPENYPLAIESNNTGVIFEQMAGAVIEGVLVDFL